MTVRLDDMETRRLDGLGDRGDEMTIRLSDLEMR